MGDRYMTLEILVRRKGEQARRREGEREREGEEFTGVMHKVQKVY